MTRTPDEIKKGLECCMDYQNCTEGEDPQCPYYDAQRCMEALLADALALIQQLQEEVSKYEEGYDALTKIIKRLEAERDAAVNDLHYLVNHPLSAGPCYACLHSKDRWRGGDCDPVNDDRWQWRGICKEGH